VIVVDSNVLAYFYLPCEHTPAAEALFQADPEWAAPILWRSEFRNILAAYMRRRTLTFEQASIIQREAESLLEGAEFEVDSHEVLKLVRDSDSTAYHCEMIPFGMQLDARVATLDKKLLKAFPAVAVALANP
jgi:predicted nucleic acid-binding protein